MHGSLNTSRSCGKQDAPLKRYTQRLTPVSVNPPLPGLRLRASANFINFAPTRPNKDAHGLANLPDNKILNRGYKRGESGLKIAHTGKSKTNLQTPWQNSTPIT